MASCYPAPDVIDTVLQRKIYTYPPSATDTCTYLHYHTDIRAKLNKDFHNSPLCRPPCKVTFYILSVAAQTHISIGMISQAQYWCRYIILSPELLIYSKLRILFALYFASLSSSHFTVMRNVQRNKSVTVLFTEQQSCSFVVSWKHIMICWVASATVDRLKGVVGQVFTCKLQKHLIAVCSTDCICFI